LPYAFVYQNFTTALEKVHIIHEIFPQFVQGISDRSALQSLSFPDRLNERSMNIPISSLFH
jgi:hypothetical protein